jgi:hypothetical protein
VAFLERSARELEASARTIVSVAVYVATERWVFDEVTGLAGFILNECAAVVLAVLAGALVSQRGWSRLTLRVAWSLKGIPIEGPTYRFDYKNDSPARILTLSIVRGNWSVLAWLTSAWLRRLSMEMLISHRPAGVVRLTVDDKPEGSAMRVDETTGALCIPLASDGASGPVTSADIGHRVLNKPIYRPCEIDYEVRLSDEVLSKREKLALRLIRIDPNLTHFNVFLDG